MNHRSEQSCIKWKEKKNKGKLISCMIRVAGRGVDDCNLTFSIFDKYRFTSSATNMDDDEISAIIETIKRYRRDNRNAIIKFIDPVDDKILEELPLLSSNSSNFTASNIVSLVSSDHLSSTLITEEQALEHQLLKAKEEVRLIEARLSQPKQVTLAASHSVSLLPLTSSTLTEEDDSSDLSEITSHLQLDQSLIELSQLRRSDRHLPINNGFSGASSSAGHSSRKRRKRQNFTSVVDTRDDIAIVLKKLKQSYELRSTTAPRADLSKAAASKLIKDVLAESLSHGHYPTVSARVDDHIVTSQSSKMLGYFLRSVLAKKIKQYYPLNYQKACQTLLGLKNNSYMTAYPNFYDLIQNRWPKAVKSEDYDQLMSLPILRADISWTDWLRVLRTNKLRALDTALDDFEEWLKNNRSGTTTTEEEKEDESEVDDHGVIEAEPVVDMDMETEDEEINTEYKHSDYQPENKAHEPVSSHTEVLDTTSMEIHTTPVNNYTSLSNPDRRCSVNVIVQVLYMIKEIHDALILFKAKTIPDNRLILQLKDVFEQLNSSHKSNVTVRLRHKRNPSVLIHSRNTQLLRHNEDAHENLAHIRDQLCTHIRSIERLVRGELQVTITCQCGHSHVMTEFFMDYPLLFQATSIALAIQGNLNSDNQSYRCRSCNNQLHTSTIRRRFLTLPPILILYWQYHNSAAATQTIHTIPITFDLDILVESCVDNDQFGRQYSLITIIIHDSTRNHYYAHIRTDTGWLCFDDDEVTPINEADVVCGFSEMIRPYTMIYRQQA